MKVQAKVKVLNDAVQRTDRAGHDYMSQQMVMEAMDGEGTARWIVSLNDEMQQRVREQAITVGCTIEVNILFDTFTAQSGYVGNKVSINAITLVARADTQQQTVPAPQTPTQSSGCASDYGFANMQGFNPTERP